MSADVVQVVATVPRVTLSRAEAAASLGVSLTTFETRIQPELKVIRVGSKVLVPLSELQRWTEANAEHVLPRSAA